MMMFEFETRGCGCSARVTLFASERPSRLAAWRAVATIKGKALKAMMLGELRSMPRNNNYNTCVPVISFERIFLFVRANLARFVP